MTLFVAARYLRRVLEKEIESSTEVLRNTLSFKGSELPKVQHPVPFAEPIQQMWLTPGSYKITLTEKGWGGNEIAFHSNHILVVYISISFLFIFIYMPVIFHMSP